MAFGKLNMGKPPVRFNEGVSETIIGLGFSTRLLRLCYLAHGKVKMYRIFQWSIPKAFNCPLSIIRQATPINYAQTNERRHF